MTAHTVLVGCGRRGHEAFRDLAGPQFGSSAVLDRALTAIQRAVTTAEVRYCRTACAPTVPAVPREDRLIELRVRST